MLSLNDQRFSALIGSVYDAAIQPAGWRNVLSSIPSFALTNVLDFVELQAQPRTHTSQPTWTAINYATHGLSPEAEKDLMLHWAYQIPLTNDIIQLAMRQGQVIATPEQTSPTFDFERSAFNTECARPNDFRYMLGVSAVSADRQSLFILALNRSKRHGTFSNAEGQLLSALLPHLLRAHRIGQTLRELQLVQSVQAAALDHSPVPVLGLMRGGQVVYANAAADQLLRQGQVLQIRHGLITCDHPQEQQALLRSMERLAHLGLDPAGRPEDRLVFSRRNQPPLSGLLLPALPAWPVGAFTLMLKDPLAQRPSPLGLLQHLYGLTPAEARVATLLAGGLSVQEISDQVGSALFTVRNQLKQVYAKTGTGRQGEVIRLILNLS